MADKISRARRSANMAAIRAQDTQPELVVRRLVYGLGYRYRLNVKTMPGKPDLVLRPLRKIIFMHGCFWHQHPSSHCADARPPQSNKSYWGRKLRRNVERDNEHLVALKHGQWKVLTIWECETNREAALLPKLRRFLSGGRQL